MPRRIPCLVVAAALSAAVQARADTLVVCTEGGPDFLNAALGTASTSFDMTEQTSDRLIGMEVGGSGLVPALAESWSVSEDGLTYAFNQSEQEQRAFCDEMPGLLFADVDAFAVIRHNVQSFKLHVLGGQPFGGVSLAP